MRVKNIKSLQIWFKSHIKDQGTPYTLDKNQAKIVLDTHKNTLVTARAGSGKTRTIVAKITYLITHEKIPPENIIVFAFNRKARAEINERLTKITYDDTPLFTRPPAIATTFHAFAYDLLGGKTTIGNNIITEAHENRLLHAIFKRLNQPPTQDTIDRAKQFITRAEQQYFQDYKKLASQIAKDSSHYKLLRFFEKILTIYHAYLKKHNLINFNQMIAIACQKIEKSPYEYIFIDEYQDFSLLFLTLIKSLRQKCPDAHLLAVGDDWQAINRFAGSNVEYFQHFEKYFPEDCVKLFIPTNYRSGKRIVDNANFFMSRSLKDYNGCKSGNRLKSQIFVCDVNQIDLPLSKIPKDQPLDLTKYYFVINEIIAKNPGKSIKILSRNNNLSIKNLSLESFCAPFQNTVNLTFSTIHRSKGLEADIVVLLEIDAKKFPAPDKTNELYKIFGDTAETLLEDEHRLFYVALTRPKEKLYILTKTAKIYPANKKFNFLSYLNEEWLNPLF